MEKMSNLYIEWNKENFKTDSFSVFTLSFAQEERGGVSVTTLPEDFQAVLDAADDIYQPTLPPKSWFRNIEDEIDYFDDEYDEFVERIEQKNYQRSLENNQEQLWLDTQETLFLDDEEQQKALDDYRKSKSLTE